MFRKSVSVTLLLLAAQAFAGSDTSSGPVAVTINVKQSCTVGVNTLDLQSYTWNEVKAETILNVTCTSGTSYSLGLDAGVGPGATVAVRKMVFADNNTLDYSLYQDLPRSVVWGNTEGQNTVSGTGTGLSQPFTVYGGIFADQPVPTGSYRDTVTATVYF